MGGDDQMLMFVDMVGGGGQMLMWAKNRKKIYILTLKCCEILQLSHDLGTYEVKKDPEKYWKIKGKLKHL